MLNTFKYRNIVHSKFWSIIFIGLIWIIADNALEFVFPTYLESIGKSYILIGILLSLPAIIGLIVDFPLGNLSDRWSRKRLMIWGLVLSPLFGILIFLFKSNIALFVIFLLWGIAYQTWFVPREAYFATLTSKKRRGEQYGVSTEFFYLGETIGPLIGGVLLSSFGEISNLGFYVVLCLIAAGLVSFTIKEKRNRKNRLAETVVQSEMSVAKNLSVLRSAGSYTYALLYLVLLFTALSGAIFTLEPLFYSFFRLDPAMGGLILAAFSFPAIFLGAPFGKLADRLGKKSLLFIGLLVAGFSLILFGIAAATVSFLIFAAITSVGIALSRPALSGLIVDLSYKHRKGELAGIWAFFGDAGFVAGPILGGVFAQFSGLRGAFVILGWIIIISAIILILVRKKPHEYL